MNIAQPPVVDPTLFQSEQRRFRRLEVSLPVWIGREEDLQSAPARDADFSPWSLGYTRDISMGGAKIIVPRGEERKWVATAQSGMLCLLRFDVSDDDPHAIQEYVEGRVRHAAYDRETGVFWLGVEFEETARDARIAAMRAGLASVKRRRGWQGAFVLALMLIAMSALFINQQRDKLMANDSQIASLRAQRVRLEKQFSRLSRADLVGTRAEGINLSFQRRDVQERLQALGDNMKKWSSEANQSKGEAERARRREIDGVALSSAPTTGAQVQLGVALPYGYAWPIVVSDLEQALGRRVPTVVVFRDWKAPFPIEDAREARMRAKTLQITWEPWHFSDPNAVKLGDIIAGKSDSYIDSWAQAAKSYGSEIWMRWGHEFNGNWYPWSVGNNGQNAQTYVKAFRHVRDRFSRAGVYNVRWIWCLNAESVPDVGWNDPARAYPGDAYVDMISIDGYNFGTALPSSRWQSFTDVFSAPYTEMTRRFPNKPIMIGEIGCATVGGDKVRWIRDMDTQLRGPFKRIEGVVWFEAAKEADWRMMSSPAALEASRGLWLKSHYRRGES